MRRFVIAALISLVPLTTAAAPLTTAQERVIDESITESLAQTGAPSVSIAVASGNEIAYAKAYGNARLYPDVPATTQTRYAIGRSARTAGVSQTRNRHCSTLRRPVQVGVCTSIAPNSISTVLPSLDSGATIRSSRWYPLPGHAALRSSYRGCCVSMT